MNKQSMLYIDDIQSFLALAPEWSYDSAHGGRIHREYLFKDFVSAFAFMTQCALWAEKAGHHPDWSNAYNRVHISLTTHDIGGLSQKDIDFAKFADAVYRVCE